MNTILIGNLIKIRWFAILGQLSAIVFVKYLLNIPVLIIESFFIIFLSILVNFISYFIQKNNSKISNRLSFLFLVFDTTQLGLLLYISGGVFNPFAILIVAPIIISASYLDVFWTILLSTYSILLLIIINFNFIPISWSDTFIVPELYKIGILVSLIITIIFVAVYAYLFANSSRKISEALSETKLQLSNQKKIKEVGSLSAAAVHELSTPLNTIFLVLNDLLKEKKLINDKNIKKDVELLKSQAERCKQILLRLSKNPLKLKDSFIEKMKLSDLIKLNFEKFNENKKIKFINSIKDDEPETFFKDEIVYALSNIIQNAIIYSSSLVTVKIDYDNISVNIQVSNDGNNFPKEILDKIGEPYVSKNKKGMGLGIFIAKNLIENIGGDISFYNSKKGDASVEIIINRSILYT